MASLADIRNKYPEYANRSDQELADALHRKYYSSVPKNEFYSHIGLSHKETPITEKQGLSGIGSDIFDLAVNKANSLPESLMNLPQEAIGAGKQILQNPGRATKNIGAGLGELGHGILSAPGNLRDYLVAKGMFPKDTSSFRLPENVLPQEFNYPEATGVQGRKPGDELIRGIPTGIAAAPLTNPIFKALGELPLTKGVGAKSLKKAQSLAKERNVTGLPISKSVLNEVKKTLPSSSAYNDLMKQASKGDYGSLFTLQSDLGKIGSHLTNSSSGAERLAGIEASKLRHKLIGEVREHLAKAGHKDIADLMAKGQNKYRQYHKLEKNVYKPLSKLGIPIGGLATLEFVMNKLRSNERD